MRYFCFCIPAVLRMCSHTHYAHTQHLRTSTTVSYIQRIHTVTVLKVEHVQNLVANICGHIVICECTHVCDTHERGLWESSKWRQYQLLQQLRQSQRIQSLHRTPHRLHRRPDTLEVRNSIIPCTSCEYTSIVASLILTLRGSSPYAFRRWASGMTT